MATTIRFNTGRKYTAHGQRITATLHDDGVVTFFDHDRQVDGQFVLGLHCSFNQVEVMHWYDSGTANGTTRSWSDGMMADGVNNKVEAAELHSYRVWISGQKAQTLVVREFASAIAARLWIAARYDLKTYDAVAQRVRA